MLRMVSGASGSGILRAVGDRLSGTSSTGSLASELCPCGNVLSPDAVFCWRCGRRRQEEPESRTHHLPVWRWSRGGLAPRLRKRKHRDFRFLDRQSVYGQSKGDWNVLRTASKHANEIKKLYWSDLYHTFLDGGTYSQLFVFSAVYICFYNLLAVAFLWISEDCNLSIEGKYLRAYYLAVETFATIGYGVPDPYFNNCWQGTWLLTIEALVGYFFNAVVIGSIFVRLTRPQKRADMILFSQNAVIQEIKGSLYFMFQVCEIKTNDLIEAKVTCHCIRHDRNGDQTYQTYRMRLQHPDDELGGHLLLTLPQKIVHRIDDWSPLSPASLGDRRKQNNDRGSFLGTRLNTRPAPTEYFRPNDGWTVPMRQADAEQGNRDTCMCTVCGSSFNTVEQLRRHIDYLTDQDIANNVPHELRHRPWSAFETKAWGWTVAEPREESEHATVFDLDGEDRPPPRRRKVVSTERRREAVEAFLAERYVEVVVLVEGVEPTTSCSLQARHSYVFPHDVLWDRGFAECTLFGKQGAPCAVDLRRFQDLVPRPPIRQGEAADRPRISTIKVGPRGRTSTSSRASTPAGGGGMGMRLRTSTEVSRHRTFTEVSQQPPAGTPTTASTALSPQRIGRDGNEDGDGGAQDGDREPKARLRPDGWVEVVV